MRDGIAATRGRWGLRRPHPVVAPQQAEGAPLASVVVVTYNRLRMLERCVSSVLANTTDVEFEVVVWNNASDDGTTEYLDAVAAHDPRVRVLHSSENVGLNGVARGVREARGVYIVEMDDDVLDLPPGWLAEMIRVFDAVPRAGYLAANVVVNDLTTGAKPPANHYRTRDFGDGAVVEIGPAGGWCSITSRKVVASVGGFLEMPGRVFFAEDEDFARRCRSHRFRVGVIRDVVVYHATGLAANEAFGYLGVYEAKYADDPVYRPFIEAAKKARERRADP
jgi:GT2 family glycosyltransferase